MNESEGRKACLKRRLISLHESFRIFFRQRRFLFSFGPPICQSDVVVGGFPPHYTGNICISVCRLNIHEVFRYQEDFRGRYHSMRKVHVQGTILPFHPFMADVSSPSARRVCIARITLWCFFMEVRKKK